MEVTAHVEDEACSPSPLAGPREAREPTVQPWGMYLHNNAESVACPSLMKQTAWENDQANDWQLPCYIRNPVLNNPLLKNARLYFTLCMQVAPFMWKETFPAVEWSKTTCIGSMERKDYYFLVPPAEGKEQAGGVSVSYHMPWPYRSPAHLLCPVRALHPNASSPHRR